ncbi:hypothetical protein SDC9_23763 [bioreactor metagenome]|uniref:Uncharacterized protein n=1 Tax=bioreactor metagenome TaxID=1076179 RepID=A0A644UGE8_9ZZZZ
MGSPLPSDHALDELPKKHDEKPEEEHDELPKAAGDSHLLPPLVQGRLGVCPGIDRGDRCVIGIAGNGHRIAVETDLEGVGPKLRGNADVPGCFGTDFGRLGSTAVPECGLEIRTAGEGGDRGRILSPAVGGDLNLAGHFGGVRVEVAHIGLVGLLPELDFGKAEGICNAGNFCDDRIIRGGVRKFCTEDPLCGLRDCCLNEICCHGGGDPSRPPKAAEMMSKSLICRTCAKRT